MVYLLRFSQPLGDPSRPRCSARFYLGWCPDAPGALDARLAEHRAGRGAKITAAAVAVGAELLLVRTWPGADRKRERAMKKRGPARYAPPPPPAERPSPDRYDPSPPLARPDAATRCRDLAWGPACPGCKGAGTLGTGPAADACEMCDGVGWPGLLFEPRAPYDPRGPSGSPDGGASGGASPARFPLGRLLATPGALDGLDLAALVALVGRHHAGDWGDVGADDARANEEALRTGARLFSSYRTPAGTRWVITEADRSATTVLCPDEY